MTEALHLLLRLVQQDCHRAGVLDIFVLLEQDPDLDSTVAPEVSSHVPAQVSGRTREREASPVLRALERTTVEVLCGSQRRQARRMGDRRRTWT